MPALQHLAKSVDAGNRVGDRERKAIRHVKPAVPVLGAQVVAILRKRHAGVEIRTVEGVVAGIAGEETAVARGLGERHLEAVEVWIMP